MKTVAEYWDDYERAVVPKGADDSQRFQTKCAFYAGASSVFELMLDAGNERGEAGHLAFVFACGAELQAFRDNIIADAGTPQ